mgnify:CR=1 FL=1
MEIYYYYFRKGWKRMDIKIQSHIKKVADEIIEMRRQLHRYPELSNEEIQTSTFVKQKLREYGIPFESGFAKTGVLGIIHGQHPGKKVALRADMDALPIDEQNNCSYASKHRGIMHACGHDAHTAMLLGAAKVLTQLKEDIYGTILLVFQPAEEDAPIGGAKAMLDDGVFSNYTPDVIYGQHVWPDLPVGKVGIRNDEMMGASDRFRITLTGSGGHASMPHSTSDAIVTAGYLITSLQTIVSRNVDPLHASVVTIAKINGGYAPNVIADEVTLEGSIRMYNQVAKKRIKERFFAITNQVANMFNATVEIDYQDGYPPTINIPRWASLARKSARKILGTDATPEVNPALTAEDFSHFLNKYPGAFIWLGTQIDDVDKQKPLHDPAFKLNERALPMGSSVLVQIAIDALNKLREDQSQNDSNLY